MPEVLAKLKQQIAEFWSNLDKSQKHRLYITSAIVAIAVTLAIIFLSKPNNITLISNADQKQIGEMSAILNENKIWNSIENGGTSIVINSRDNNKAQVALAQKGYPKGGMTFEDAIKMIGISTTESDKKHIWKQQQMSDLEAKLKMLDNIEEATVSLALPERSIFLTSGQEQQKPTAYVMVKPGEPLTPQQVEGIVMLVSRSIENLSPKDITVVDNNSNILNRELGDESIDRVNSQEEMRLKKAIELQNRVYDYFSVGKFDNFDTIRVVANPFLDFNTKISKNKLISNPEGMDGPAVISSDKTQETLKNGAPNGVPGTDTNPGNANSPSYQIGNNDNSSYEKKQETMNYEYNETLSEEEKATGVMVPEMSTMAISLWYGSRVTDDSKLSDEFINQVKIAASTATGIPVDNISVNKLKLAPPEVVKKSAFEQIKELISDYGFFLLLFLLIIALMIAAIPRKKQAGEAALSQLEAAAAAGLKFAVPETAGESIPEIQFEERSEIKKQIEKFVRQKPEAVAQLLRNWLSDDWDT